MYIGTSSMIKHRWRGDGIGYKGSTRIEAAINKFGWDNFKKEILYSDLTQDEAYKLERELIEAYKTTDERYGYNLENGGNLGKKSHPTSIEKVRKANIGHPVSFENIQKLRVLKSKRVICLETKQTFFNAREAAEMLELCASSISKTCNGKQAICGGLHFAYLDDYENNSIPKYIPKTPIWRNVICVTTGEIYENVCDASRKTGINRRGIAYACEGKYKQFKGLEWKYATRCVEHACYYNNDCICTADDPHPELATLCPNFMED